MLSPIYVTYNQSLICYKSMLQPQYTNCVSCISAFFVGGGGGGGGCYKSILQPQYTNCVSCISAFFVGGGGGGGGAVTNPCYNLNTQTVYLVSVPFLLGGGGGGGGGLLQIHVTTSIHKLCILYQCLFCWGGGGGAVTNPCYNLNTQTMYLVSVPFFVGGGGGGAVTNPCYNLNTQTVYLVSVPFLLGGGGGGGGGCYKSMLQPQYTNCVSCISAFFVGGGLLQIHVTTSIHKLCILYQCLLGGLIVHICAFEWYTKTTSAGTLTHWGRDKTAAILHFILWKFSYFDSSFNEIYSCWQYTSIGYQIMAWRRAGSKPLSEPLIA